MPSSRAQFLFPWVSSLQFGSGKKPPNWCYFTHFWSPLSMCKNSKQKIKAEHFLYIYTHRHSHIQGCKCSLPRSPSCLTLARLSSSRGWKFETDLRQKYMLWFIMSIFQGKSGLCFYWTECIQLQQHLFFFPTKFCYSEKRLSVMHCANCKHVPVAHF